MNPLDSPVRKSFLETKAGQTFVINRKPDQDAKRFKGNVDVFRSQYKIKYGIKTECEFFENHAVIKVLRDLSNPLPENERRKFNNPRRKDRKPGEVKTIYEAPKPEPKPEPAPEPAKPVAVAAMREDESAFWRDLFKTSLTSAPSADPTHHARVAKAGVEAYRARFAPA